MENYRVSFHLGRPFNTQTVCTYVYFIKIRLISNKKQSCFAHCVRESELYCIIKEIVKLFSHFPYR